MRNSSYNLVPILLKLRRHCDHALKICMWLGYTPQIKFCHFFLQFELSHFFGHFYIFSSCIAKLASHCYCSYGTSKVGSGDVDLSP